MPQTHPAPDRDAAPPGPAGGVMALRAALATPLGALAEGLDRLRIQHGDAVTTVDPKLHRQILSARMNFPVATATSAAQPASTAGRLLGPDRVLVTSVARMAQVETAHTIRAAHRLDARILGAMGAVLAHLSAAAPHHVHTDATCLTAMLGAPQGTDEGRQEPTILLTLNGINVFSGPALPDGAARMLARRAALLAGDAPAAEAPLPWRQFRVNGETIPAPTARRAAELYLALAAPRALIDLRDPDLPHPERARLRATLPEVSEIRAPDEMFAHLAPPPGPAG